MSKFVVTNYLNKKEILKFPGHCVAVGVTIDDTGITANSDGKKIVSAGTILGTAGANPILLDDTMLAKKTNTASVAATSTVSFGVPVANDTVIIGEHTFKYVASPANPGEFSTADGLATLINSTDEFTAVNNSGTITVTSMLKGASANSIPVGKTGTGTETISAFTGGATGTGYLAEGILLEDIDVTYGTAPGAMIVHGFIDLNKLPEIPSADARAALKLITFMA